MQAFRYLGLPELHLPAGSLLPHAGIGQELDGVGLVDGAPASVYDDTGAVYHNHGPEDQPERSGNSNGPAFVTFAGCQKDLLVTAARAHARCSGINAWTAAHRLPFDIGPQRRLGTDTPALPHCTPAAVAAAVAVGMSTMGILIAVP